MFHCACAFCTGTPWWIGVAFSMSQLTSPSSVSAPGPPSLCHDSGSSRDMPSAWQMCSTTASQSSFEAAPRTTV